MFADESPTVCLGESNPLIAPCRAGAGPDFPGLRIRALAGPLARGESWLSICPLSPQFVLLDWTRPGVSSHQSRSQRAPGRSRFSMQRSSSIACTLPEWHTEWGGGCVCRSHPGRARDAEGAEGAEAAESRVHSSFFVAGIPLLLPSSQHGAMADPVDPMSITCSGPVRHSRVG
jgi:hypothetical protein